MNLRRVKKLLLIGTGVLAIAALGVSVVISWDNYPLSAPQELGVEEGTEEKAVHKNSDSLSGQDLFSEGPEFKLVLLKDVGEPQYFHFGLAESDFKMIRDAGFTVIEGTFDICAGREDVQFFLNQAHVQGLKVILNAGAGEAEWGYACDGTLTIGQTPVWQGEQIKAWVRMWKDHPAVFAWDISNEDGGTMPFGTGGVNPQPNWQEKYALTPEQLRNAYREVKEEDPEKPIMIRMNGWYFYDNEDNFFKAGNYFAKDVADIVMVNAYSNVEEYFPDFVKVVMERAFRSIRAVDSDVVLLPSLGVWTEPPLWFAPTKDEFLNDLKQAERAEGSIGIAYFKYGSELGEGWFLPHKTRGDPELWKLISENNVLF